MDERYRSLVVDRGPTEHQTNVHPMARFEQIAAASKSAVDTVFGSYARGPAFVARRNLVDRFEAIQRDQAHMTGPQRVESARMLLEYATEADRGIRTINREHSAVPEHRQERQIIAPILRSLARQHTQRLLDIDRGWPGAQDPTRHRVEIQRFRKSDPREDRRFMWYNFQMLMHEYLHSLTHSRYSEYAARLGGRRYNTLIEGMTSVVTDIAWSNTAGRVADQSLRDQVEGQPYAQEPFDPTVIPPISSQRYPSFNEAMNIVSIAGERNVFAAYFLGMIDFIRAARSAPHSGRGGTHTADEGSDRWVSDDTEPSL
jgi:hypothetical protein